MKKLEITEDTFVSFCLNSRGNSAALKLPLGIFGTVRLICLTQLTFSQTISGHSAGISRHIGPYTIGNLNAVTLFHRVTKFNTMDIDIS